MIKYNQSFHIELNSQFKKALDLIENTSKSVFITGRAGTGKSTLLKFFRRHTSKDVIVLASTGVAALNVGGETIHSFFGFKPDITIDKVKKLKGAKSRSFKKINAIVIDEVSMVRADLLDCVDAFLRLNGRDPNSPFGGTKMIFIGDLYQLPPVVSFKEREFFSRRYSGPYFFDADAFENFEMEFVELEKIYRQKSQDFISILNAVRDNSVGIKELSVLNSRVGLDFEKTSESERIISLVTTNKAAYEINRKHSDRLWGKEYIYESDIDGEFSSQSYPADEELFLKIGAQIMLLNNDAAGRWVNGSIGMIVDIVKDLKGGKNKIMVMLSNGKLVEVLPFTWELFHFKFDDKTDKIVSESIGSFRQYPLKLAWAITIHKSQGKTFDKVIIDLGHRAFTAGQVYVALSRCVSLEGISLARPIRKSDIIIDRRIGGFIFKYQYNGLGVEGGVGMDEGK
ncbi:MAG: AAA family ATPase [Elusimicrobiales bacterium]|nr:AAA family ATPase [Elusimicrobiales bacterium]